MSGPSYFVKSLLRIAKLQGREVLESLVIGQFQVISEGGGKILSGSSIGGKSFSFQVPGDMTTAVIISSAEEALEWHDGSTSEQIDKMLSTHPITVVRGRF